MVFPASLRVISFVCDQLEVPTELVSPIQLASLHMRWQPQFVAVTDVADARNLSKYSDEATGVVQRCLSNGIRVNYKVLNCF